MSDHGDSAEAGSRDARLSREFVRLADTLVDDFDVVELLDNLVHTCVDLLGVTAAGLLLLDHRQNLQPVASSDETSWLIELFQLQNDEGPCLDCVRSGEPIHTTGVGRMNDRWPRFGPAAERSGFSAVSALPLRLRHDVIGSLNLFYADGLAPVLPADTRSRSRSPTSPPSASSSNVPCTGPRCWPSSCRPRSTPGSSSSRPRGCSRSTAGSTWARRSKRSAATRASTA
jgi:hypothetical protein